MQLQRVGARLHVTNVQGLRSGPGDLGGVSGEAWGLLLLVVMGVVLVGLALEV